ncbi:MAG TPA: hypothetical protein VFC85_08555 [Verrucomicrobiae bacterium]|nr:hypothetical protein [Verrucomicrobiae bacterium]
MKKNLLLGVAVLLAGSVMAASSSPKDDVKKAAAALGNETNYTWQATVEVPEDSQFKPGPTDGKTQKNGYTTLSFSFGDNTTEAVTKGTNGAVKTDDGWKSLSEATKDDGSGGFNPTMFIARMVQNYKVPAVEAASLADDAKELNKGTNGISGDLTEAGAKELLSFRRGRNGGDGPTITNPKGSVKFWLKDGKLAKYQYHVSGTVSFNGNDRDVDRTTTVEIKDVNTTKIELADDAKKKLQ